MYHTATIIRRQLASPTVVILDLQVSSSSSLSSSPSSSSLTSKPFSFSPGQWVDFVVKPNDWIGGFSIASSPRDLPKITLAIKRSNHPPSMWVHNESSVGKTVEIQVGGTCILEEEEQEEDNNNDQTTATTTTTTTRRIAKPAVFCAGGIGISPILSQYREFLFRRDETQKQQQQMMNNQNYDSSDITSSSLLPLPKSMFYYSVSAQDELVFGEELLLDLKRDPTLDKVVLSLTKSSKWEEKKEGSIFTNEIMTKLTNSNVEFKAGGGNGRMMMKSFFNDYCPKDATYYICGPPKMIDDAVLHLSSIGISNENMKYEKWW